MIGPARLWHDLQHLAGASAALACYLARPDPVEVSLALFSADAPAATRGSASTYTARIASAGTEPRSVRLFMDFYALNVPAAIDGHYAYFSRSLRIPPRAATIVQIRYDWERTVRFCHEGISSAPDDLWRGAEGLPRVYAVYALIVAASGLELDRQVIAQELRG